MDVIHLSKKEAMGLASDWAKSINCMSHENHSLWAFIKDIKSSFRGLTWREDKKCFAVGL